MVKTVNPLSVSGWYRFGCSRVIVTVEILIKKKRSIQYSAAKIFKRFYDSIVNEVYLVNDCAI